jgi:hypothetical protein
VQLGHVQISKSLGLWNWRVIAPEAYQSGSTGGLRYYFTLQLDHSCWLQRLPRVRVPLLGRWINWPAARWTTYCERPFTLIASNGRFKPQDPPAIKFWRKADALIFKLTWGGM